MHISELTSGIWKGGIKEKFCNSVHLQLAAMWRAAFLRDNPRTSHLRGFIAAVSALLKHRTHENLVYLFVTLNLLSEMKPFQIGKSEGLQLVYHFSSKVGEARCPYFPPGSIKIAQWGSITMGFPFQGFSSPLWTFRSLFDACTFKPFVREMQKGWFTLFLHLFQHWVAQLTPFCCFLPLISCSFSRNFSCLSNERKGHLRASLKEQRGEWDFSSLGRSQQSSGCTADAECPQIPNTCKHNREITNYLQFSLEKGIQRWIAHSAEVLPCLLFSSFTTKYIWVHFIMSCQRLFSLIICFISTARALLCYYSWYKYTIYSNHIPFLLQHATFHSFHIPLHNCKRISSKTPSLSSQSPALQTVFVRPAHS